MFVMKKIKKLLNVNLSLSAQCAINKRLRLLTWVRKAYSLFKFDVVFFFDYSGIDITRYFDFFIYKDMYIRHILLKYLSFYSSSWLFKEIAFKNLSSSGALCMDDITFNNNLEVFNLNFFIRQQMLKEEFEALKIVHGFKFPFLPDIIYVKYFSYMVCPSIFRLYIGFLFFGLVRIVYWYIKFFFHFFGNVKSGSKII